MSPQNLVPCLLSGLLLIVPVAAPSAPAPPAAPRDVVQQFLDARAAGRLDKAYALLSPATRKLVPAQKFQHGDVSIPEAQNPEPPPGIKAVMDMLLDTHNKEGYRLTIVGAAPDDPNTVLMSAQPPDGQKAVTFKVVTTPDTQAGGVPQIDMEATVDADPAGRDLHDQARQAMSKNNLKFLSLCITEYLQDHDETYPSADHWVEAITPYVKDKQVFHDPSAPEGEAYSYAFNRALSRRSFAEPMVPQSTVLLFESSKGVKDASDTGQSVPRPGRHHGGTDYAFVDGHVAWLRDSAKLSYRLDGK